MHGRSSGARSHDNELLDYNEEDKNVVKTRIIENEISL